MSIDERLRQFAVKFLLAMLALVVAVTIILVFLGQIPAPLFVIVIVSGIFSLVAIAIRGIFRAPPESAAKQAISIIRRL